ncbi:phospho-sugar mutase [Thermoactinomyces sp. DSM 45892]|uniref:phospho-sugar mutase n=1 Tax=Thermoactinomyces sp. DSM 45892 TaxID=1882753 RepID=UPI00089C32FA|nr:phospho-sugar mutase [Thermoactinomyces sp. DSM 45892]SDZ32386.1 alpha-phosphoglucomutase [Thermoactinomyces sp. DSM 45892]
MNYLDLYHRWLYFDGLDSVLKEELQQIQKHDQEIQERFSQSLSFGTAGIRGIIGAGTNRMNIYTVRKLAQGLGEWLHHEHLAEKGVAIGYDTRHGSVEFSREVAKVLLHLGVRVYLFEHICPSPELSFAVRYYDAAAGIMVTASHNPPNYNGIKVYGADGAQISPLITSKILDNISRISDEFMIPVGDLSKAEKDGTLVWLGSEVDQAYYENVASLAFQDKEQNKHFRIVYSPLHGTGRPPIESVLRQKGFENVFVVPEQADPDPNFSTVKSPNPEDPASFELAITYANQQQADLVLVTDPDADRIGIAIRDENGQFAHLTGNQIGALLLFYLLSQRVERGALPSDGALVKSIVSSDLGGSIATHFGVTTQNTLTGFRYIGELIQKWKQTGEHTFLFGYEESYGYLIGDFCRDKDAAQACLLLAELGAYYQKQGMPIYQVLDMIYKKFGYFQETQISVTLEGLEGGKQLKEIMVRTRSNPPSHVAGIAVCSIQDYLQGVEGFPKADVLKYLLGDGSWFAIRPSGTEPKMKCYVGVKGSSSAEVEEKRIAIKEYLTGWLGF